jgi:glycosyltransferase involved in cell wall biosynthesis
MVSSDIEGSRELVLHERTGLMFPLGRADALSDCMRRLANDPALRARLSVAARERVNAEFSAEAMAQRYLRLFLALRKRPPDNFPEVAD